MTAIPSAVPIRWAVPRMPLAVPASRRGTPASTKSWFGAIVMPLPRPASSSGATRYQPLTAGAVRCAILGLYSLFGVLLVPYRLLRRHWRRERQRALRHQELLAAMRSRDGR